MGTKISELLSANAAAINADPTYFCAIVDGANRKVALTEVVASLGLAAVATSGAYSSLTGKPTLGTAAALDTGTSANKVVKLDGSAKLPAVDGSQLTNLAYASIADAPSLATVATSGSYNDLADQPTFGTSPGDAVVLDGFGKLPAVDGSQLTGLGTAAALDVGTGANDVVQLDGTGKLPAVDGSQLTGVVGGNPFDQDLNTGDAAQFHSLNVGSTAAATRQFSVDDPSGYPYQSFNQGGEEISVIGSEPGAGGRSWLVYVNGNYPIEVSMAGDLVNLIALSIGGVPFPSLPTADGDYKLTVSSGVLSWAAI